MYNVVDDKISVRQDQLNCSYVKRTNKIPVIISPYSKIFKESCAEPHYLLVRKVLHMS